MLLNLSWFLVPRIWLFEVFKNPDMWKIHSSENNLMTETWKRRNGGHTRRIKGNLSSTMFGLYLMYPSSIFRKHVNQLFPDILYDGLKNPYTSNHCSQGPSWALAKTGIGFCTDCSKTEGISRPDMLLTFSRPLTISTHLDISVHVRN